MIDTMTDYPAEKQDKKRELISKRLRSNITNKDKDRILKWVKKKYKEIEFQRNENAMNNHKKNSKKTKQRLIQQRNHPKIQEKRIAREKPKVTTQQTVAQTLANSKMKEPYELYS